MAQYGFACRGSSGYVTDAANDTYVLGETSAQTRNGITFNWTATGGAWTAPGASDVDNTFDLRLAGINYAGPSTAAKFNVTLPATGTYNVRLAVGDVSFGATLTNQRVVIKDNGTTRLTVGPTDVIDQCFMDASGAVRSRGNWPVQNTLATITFTSTVMTLELDGGSTYGCLAYLSVTPTSASGGGGRAALLGVGR